MRAPEPAARTAGVAVIAGAFAVFAILAGLVGVLALAGAVHVFGKALQIKADAETILARAARARADAEWREPPQDPLIIT